MELNININFGFSPELQQILSAAVSAYEKDITSKKELVKCLQEANQELQSRSARIDEFFRNLKGSSEDSGKSSEAASEGNAAPTEDQSPSPEPALNPEKRVTRRRSSKKSASDASAPEVSNPASETTSPEPADHEPARDDEPKALAPDAVVASASAEVENQSEDPQSEDPQSEDPWALPFPPEYSAAGSTRERPEMTLDTARQVLADTRQRLLLEEGQEHFDKKRDFNNAVKRLITYYGGDRLSALTPANLYWAAEQITRIQLADDGTFLVSPSIITPEQVEEFKNAPFKK